MGILAIYQFLVSWMMNHGGLSSWMMHHTTQLRLGWWHFLQVVMMYFTSYHGPNVQFQILWGFGWSTLLCHNYVHIYLYCSWPYRLKHSSYLPSSRWGSQGIRCWLEMAQLSKYPYMFWPVSLLLSLTRWEIPNATRIWKRKCTKLLGPSSYHLLDIIYSYSLMKHLYCSLCQVSLFCYGLEKTYPVLPGLRLEMSFYWRLPSFCHLLDVGLWWIRCWLGGKCM